MKRLIFASRNAGKVVEVRRLLEPFGFVVQTMAEAGLDEDLPEEGCTFEANAESKASALRILLGQEDVWTLADDSGLVVDALDGAPGVYSARFSGYEGADARARDRANNAKLLKDLAQVEGVKRSARFVCCLVLLGPDVPLVLRGTCEGRILDAPRGEGGFGYDPLFLPEGFSRSMAELGLDEKNRISHRGQALARLVERLRDQKIVT
ncbi:MAG: RdgB/HAM1 family non-canonical purine NTP pyrophosphatase [Deltaproteobacteria bacterium]|nr:RdgB/HAM1 family non-canonical purine NTP pyrophosphatase [Deltaproteobacteria bacterium]